MRSFALLQPSSELVGLTVYTISKITLLSVAVSYICFTTHSSVNCGYDTCRGSPRGTVAVPPVVPWVVPVVFTLQAAAQNRGQSAADLTVLLPEVNQPRQMEFSFSRDLGLLGSNIAANRRPRQAGSGHHSTGPTGQRETPSLWLTSPDKY